MSAKGNIKVESKTVYQLVIQLRDEGRGFDARIIFDLLTDLSSANDDYNAMKAELARVTAERDKLLSMVIQPWTREGDGKKMFRVNLAWWDSALTYDDALQMIGFDPVRFATTQPEEK